MGILRRPRRAKNCQNIAISINFFFNLGSYYVHPFHDLDQIWQVTRLQVRFHLNPFLLSPSRDEKPKFWANFDIWGEGWVWCARVDPRATLRLLTKFCLDQFILSLCGGEKPQILPFYCLWHFVVSPVGSDLRKLNTSAQLQAFPYPTLSKSFLYSNAFIA